MAITDSSISEGFRILVATDTHLGYAENDGERGNDSFNTFEEILQIAKSQQVDFILLAGDLFHETKPSTNCLHKCMNLLRKYCMGDRPIAVEFLSDQNVNFQHCYHPVVNYEDPNLNISIPVFSIHGNHDDPTGQEQLCSLDLLSTSGLVNYFGKSTDLREVKISPLLMKKGETRIAIYGLSHIKDDRLSRLFRDKQVKMYRPNEFTNDWINIFVCHQNRADRGINKFIREEELPDFLDVVLWGHEHECRIKLEKNETSGFYVSQPGSSVATSLCEGEAKEKYVGLLEIHKNNPLKLQPIKLQTVRPFIFQTLKLSECTLPICDSTVNSVQVYLNNRIEMWLKDVVDQYTGHEMQPKLPLVRIRVEYNDEAQCFNTIRFGYQYQNVVANPADMILLKKEKRIERRVKENNDEERQNMEEFLQNEEIADIWEVKMNILMQKYFDEESKNKFKIFSVKGISDATARFIDKSDNGCIKAIVEHQMNKIENHLCTKKVDVDKLDDEIKNYMLRRSQNSESETAELKKLMDELEPSANNDNELTTLNDSDNAISDDEQMVIPTGRGRGRSRGNRGGRAVISTTSVPKTISTKNSSRARARARGTHNTTTRGSIAQMFNTNTSFTNNKRETRRNTRLNYDLSSSDED